MRNVPVPGLGRKPNASQSQPIMAFRVAVAQARKRSRVGRLHSPRVVLLCDAGRRLGGQLAVRRRGGVQDQAAGVADIGEVREQLDVFDEPDPGLVAALDAEGEDRAGAFGRYFRARSWNGFSFSPA